MLSSINAYSGPGFVHVIAAMVFSRACNGSERVPPPELAGSPVRIHQEAVEGP